MVRLLENPIELIDAVTAVLSDKACVKGWSFYAPPKPSHLGTRFAHMVTGGVATCHGLFSGSKCVGFLMGLYVPCLITGVDTALEYLWLTLPEYRAGGQALDLLTMFEQEARVRGCKVIITGSSAFVKPKAMRRFYLARGYVPHAEAFRKEL